MATECQPPKGRGLESPQKQGKMAPQSEFNCKTMSPLYKKTKQKQRKQSKTRVHIPKKDPLMVGGQRPRPMFVDYKDVELLKKLTSRQGKILSRRKSGCSAISQHAVAVAIKRARFMALLPYVAD